MAPDIQTGVAADVLTTSKGWLDAISAPPVNVNDALADARIAGMNAWQRLVNATPTANPIVDHNAEEKRREQGEMAFKANEIAKRVVALLATPAGVQLNPAQELTPEQAEAMRIVREGQSK